MSEILFRGKQIDKGEWIVGSVIVYPDGDTYIGAADDTDQDALNKYQVDPSTVGQYTGLIDKNGRKIFEGDICTITIPRIDGEVNRHENCKCEFEGGVFFFVSDDGYWWRGDEYGYTDTAHDNIEVIGNIHDNSELVEGTD